MQLQLNCKFLAVVLMFVIFFTTCSSVIVIVMLTLKITLIGEICLLEGAY